MLRRIIKYLKTFIYLVLNVIQHPFDNFGSLLLWIIPKSVLSFAFNLNSPQHPVILFCPPVPEHLQFPAGQLLVRAERVQVWRREFQPLHRPHPVAEYVAAPVLSRVRFPDVLPERGALRGARIEGQAEALYRADAEGRNGFVDGSWKKKGGEEAAGEAERRAVASSDCGQHQRSKGVAAGREQLDESSATNQLGSNEITKENQRLQYDFCRRNSRKQPETTFRIGEENIL